MDIEKKEIHIVPPQRIQQAGGFALLMLGVFLVILTIGQLKGLNYIGAGVPATNTITVSGEGEVFAVPDTATFSVTIQEEAKEVKDAQDKATKKNNDIVAYLKEAGIEEKDIQTTDYSVYPQYDYSNSVCPASSGGEAYYCPPGKQTLRGFQVSQTLTIKVRDTKKAGDLLSGVGSRGASQVSGLSFTIDDQDALEAQARGEAIDDAETKAKELASQLGVRLVRIVGYSESGNGYYPYAYGKGGVAMDMAVRSEAAMAPSPEIPTGQNKITSSVNVSYEIR